MRVAAFNLLSQAVLKAGTCNLSLCYATARTVIRMDTLQAYSRLLAERIAKVSDSSGQQEARQLHMMCEEAVGLVCSLSAHLELASPEDKPFIEELCIALEDSAILEHVSRGVLRLQVTAVTAAPAGAEAEAPVKPDLLSRVLDSFMFILLLLTQGSINPSAAGQRRLRTVLSGRCLQYLLASQLVSTLCAIDGGPSHGLPEALLRGLPVLGGDNGKLNVRNAQRSAVLAWRPLAGLMTLGSALPCRMAPRPTLELLMRCTHLGIASMRHHQQQQPQGQRQQQPRCRLLFALEGAQHVTGQALETCKTILSGALAARLKAPAPPAAAVAGAGAAAASAESGRASGSDGTPCASAAGATADAAATVEAAAPEAGMAACTAGGARPVADAGPAVQAAPGTEPEAAAAEALPPAVPALRAVAALPAEALPAEALASGVAPATDAAPTTDTAPATDAAPPAPAAEAAGAVAAEAASAAAAIDSVTALQTEWLEWWRAALEFADRTAQPGPSYSLQSLLGLKLEPLPTSEGLVAAGPPSALTAPLAAGILPWMERALRRAAWPHNAPPSASGAVPGAAGATAVCNMLGREDAGWRLLGRLLAYGEPRQAAGMVASMGKLLRRLAAQVARASPDVVTAEMRLELMGTSTDLLKRVVVAMLVTTRSAVIWVWEAAKKRQEELAQRRARGQGLGQGQAHPSADADAAPSGPYCQLLAMLTYALMCWLPPMAEVVLGAVSEADGPGLAAMARADPYSAPNLALVGLLCSLPCPLAACTAGGGLPGLAAGREPGAAGGGSAAAGGSTGTSGDESAGAGGTAAVEEGGRAGTAASAGPCTAAASSLGHGSRGVADGSVGACGAADADSAGAAASSAGAQHGTCADAGPGPDHSRVAGGGISDVTAEVRAGAAESWRSWLGREVRAVGVVGAALEGLPAVVAMWQRRASRGNLHELVAFCCRHAAVAFPEELLGPHGGGGGGGGGGSGVGGGVGKKEVGAAVAAVVGQGACQQMSLRGRAVAVASSSGGVGTAGSGQRCGAWTPAALLSLKAELEFDRQEVAAGAGGDDGAASRTASGADAQTKGLGAQGGSAGAAGGGINAQGGSADKQEGSADKQDTSMAPDLAALADWLERSFEVGAGGQGGEDGGTESAGSRVRPSRGFGVAAWGESDRCWYAASELLPTPDELLGMLPQLAGCSNPRCVSLEGESEAGVKLQKCKGCGAVQYCSRECQVAHWRAGHKEACGRQRGG